MLRRLLLTFTILSALPLGSCMVGPDYHPPTPDTPAGWQEGKSAKAEPIKPAPRATWWKDFNDPILTKLIDKALTDNENLKTAVARIVEVRGLRESANAQLYPHIGAGAEADRSNPGVATEGSQLTVRQATFDASWEIDLFGGTRREVEAQDALIGAREAAYHNAALSLVAEVAREYITLRQFQAQLAITRETADTQHHLYDIAADRFKGGLVSTLDVAQAQTLYKTTSAKLPDLERQIKASAYRLSVLLGENPGSLNSLVKTAKPIPSARKLPVLAAPASIIRQRPDIAEAERNLAAATALQGVAISALYPKISLSALFGTQHGVLPLANYASNERIWDLGGSITMPVLEFGLIEGQINAADARQVQSMHQYRQTVIAALADIETDLSNLSKESERYATLTAAGKSADEAVSVARDRYRRGFSDFTTVLQAEQQRFAVQIDLIASQSAIAQDIIALHKALGESPATAE